MFTGLLFFAAASLFLSASGIKTRVADSAAGSSYQYQPPPTPKSEPPVKGNKPPPGVTEPYGLEDDEVQSYINNLRDPDCAYRYCKDLGLTTLCDKSTPRFISTRDRALVLFHTDVSTMSQHALWQLSAAVKEVGYTHSVGQVACHDWTDVCQRYGVYTWPTMMIFEQGEMTGTYKGVWTKSALAGFIERFMRGTPMKLRTVNDVEAFLQGDFSPFGYTDMVQRATIGLFQHYDDQEALDFIHTAKMFAGKHVMGLATSEVAEQAANRLFGGRKLPVVATVAVGKYGDLLMEHQYHTLRSTITLDHFVKSSQATGILELTTEAFPSVYRRNLPVAILIGCPMSLPNLLPVYSRVAKSLDSRVAFTYMNEKHCPKMTETIYAAFQLSMGDAPALLLSMPERGEACVFRKNDVTQMTESTMTRLLEDCLRGQSSNFKLPAHDWHDRTQLYDFYVQVYGGRPLKELVTRTPNQNQRQEL